MVFDPIVSGLSHGHYALIFAVAYTAFDVHGFYPGILYSDSSARWALAIDIADHGISALPFALSLFVFVNTYRRGATGNLFVSAVLLLPINRVYSIFHSYDSVAAIVLVLLSASTVRLLSRDVRQRYYLPPLFGLLDG